MYTKQTQIDYRIAWLLLFVVALSGCTGMNPVKVAESPEQQAYAAYGTFVIFQEKAANIVEDRTIPRGVRLKIIEAEERAKPVADSLLDAFAEFLTVKAEFQAGTTDEERFVIAANSLNDWVTQLAPLINDLVRSIKGAQQ